MEKNPLKVKFNGISFLDIQTFLKKMKIDNKCVWIFQEIPFYNEKYSLNQLQSFHHVRKRAHGFYTGNDCLLVLCDDNYDIFNYSCKEILYENRFTNKNNVSFHAWFYDIDWLADLVFNDATLFDKLMDYLQDKKVNLKEVEIFPRVKNYISFLNFHPPMLNLFH